MEKRSSRQKGVKGINEDVNKNNHLIGPVSKFCIFTVRALLPGGGRAVSAATLWILSERYNRRR